MLSSLQYSSDLRKFYAEHPLMDYPAFFQKSAHLHIQDSCHGLIRIFKINLNTPFVNVRSDVRNFFSEHTLINSPA